MEEDKSSLRSTSNDNFVPEKVSDGDLESNNRYGCFNCHPDWLQIFNNRKWLALLIGVCQLLYSIITSGYESSVVSTLQKGFDLSSTDIGGIYVCYSVAQSILGIILSHKAAKSHKGKWIGLTAIATAIGCIIYTLPHFIIESYSTLSSFEGNSNSSEFCSSSNRLSDDSSLKPPSRKGLYIFILCLGQFVIGSASSLLRTVGWSYLDENVSPSASAIYTGVNLSMLGLGIALGFIFGGFALDQYVYWPSSPPDPSLTSSNPNWIGAWWLGYIIVGVAIVAVSFPILALPRHLPNYNRYKLKRAEQAVGKSKIDRYEAKDLKDLLPSLKELLCNLPFMCTVLSLVGNLIVLSGVGVFFPKYIESQYGILASSASMYTGIMIVAGMIVGIVLGGGFLKRKKMRVLGLAKFASISTALSTISSLAFIIAICPKTLIAGVNVPYHNYTNAGDVTNLQTYNLTDSCNANCYCSSEIFKPVCDLSSGITYFSPCHAGCTSKSSSGDNTDQIFHNCTCLNANEKLLRNGNKTLDVVLNYCPKECSTLIVFILLGILFAFFVYCSLIPSYQVIFRCVPESQRPLALAVQWVFIQCLATIPGPLLLGLFIDGACSLWEVKDGVRTFCWIYDNQQLAYGLAGVIVAMKIFSSVFSVLAWYFLKRDIKKYEKIEMENVKDDTVVDDNTKNEDKSDIKAEKLSDNDHPTLTKEITSTTIIESNL